MMDKAFLTPQQVAAVMVNQLAVWEGNPNSYEAIIDCCHALASAFRLSAEEQKRFIAMSAGTASMTTKERG